MYGHKMYGPSQDPATLELHWESWDPISTYYTVLPSPLPDILRSVPMRLTGPALVLISLPVTVIVFFPV